MSLPRLRERVPSAELIGVSTLAEHSLRFHKVSKKDGSGKCDALFTKDSNDYIVGALFEISESEKEALDRAEGLGYGYQDKKVVVSDAKKIPSKPLHIMQLILIPPCCLTLGIYTTSYMGQKK